MLNSKKRTIEMYKEVGAEMRLLKALFTRLYVDSSKVLSSVDQNSLWKAKHIIEKICSKAEDNMLKDYPEVSNDYLSVFYGNLREGPRNSVDEEIIKKSMEIVNELFGKRD